MRSASVLVSSTIGLVFVPVGVLIVSVSLPLLSRRMILSVGFWSSLVP